MRKKELSRGQYRVHLDRYEYQTLLQNAPHEAGELAIRLSGESGLKVSEVINVELQHIERSEVAPDFYFLYIPTTEEDEGKTWTRGRPRRTYLPESLHELMFEYAGENEYTHTEPLIQVSKRSTQTYYKKAAEAASDVTGKDDFGLVSSLDLRIYFAKQAIERWRIHPKVVMKVGGWSDLDTLMEHLDEPSETKIVREFDRAEYLGIDEWKLGDDDRPSKEVSQLGLDDYKSN